MDRCPKIEYARLSGELGWGGINSGIISSKIKNNVMKKITMDLLQKLFIREQARALLEQETHLYIRLPLYVFNNTEHAKRTF